LSPAVGAVIIIVVLVIAGVIGWKVMSPPSYSGGPIDMGKHMGTSNAAPQGAARGPGGPSAQR
jgi:hypothetical protein